jgi:hypothetical protein
MGQLTDARIRAWQEESGIRPAEGEYRDALCRMQEEAFELIKIFELEVSGIRDGDGYWHGSDVIGSTVRGIERLAKRILFLRNDAPNTKETEVA